MPRIRKDKTRAATHDPLDQEILRNRYAQERDNPRMKSHRSHVVRPGTMDPDASGRVLRQLSEADSTPRAQHPSETDSFDFQNFDVDMQQYDNSGAAPTLPPSALDLSSMMTGAAPPSDLLDSIAAASASTPGQALIGGPSSRSHEDILSEKVARVYRELGKVLQRYRAGKLPKAFNVLPQLVEWEYCLGLTEPERWSLQSLYAAVRVFRMQNKLTVQRFYNSILLPRLRIELREHRKLNPIMFHALRRAMYKDVSFYAGVVFPICHDGSITVKEARVLGAVIKKSAVRLFSAAALLFKLTKIPVRTDGIVKIIKSFLEKKISLPNQVIDALFQYLCQPHMKAVRRQQGNDVEEIFEEEDQILHVVWLETLLLFIRLFKREFSRSQLKLMLQVCRSVRHPQLTPALLREMRQRPVAPDQFDEGMMMVDDADNVDDIVGVEDDGGGDQMEMGGDF